MGSTGLPLEKRRLALLQLSQARLNELTGRYAPEVGDRRTAEHHAEALLYSSSVDFAALLASLKREELQSMCEVLGLARGGRDKQVLVQRILGLPGAAAPLSAPSLPSKLTVDQLERHLWSAADILRGSIDSSDYKNYIFGLLFLKRLSDVFEEEAERLIAQGRPESAAWEDRGCHQFFVPRRARWGSIQKVSSNIGEALNKACSALEEQNASLRGVLAGIDFNDERKLGGNRSVNRT